MTAAILGISCDYHDAAAALVLDGELVAAAAEERFTRIKHDANLPANAMAWCLSALDEAGGHLDAVCFYSKPFSTYERILATHAAVGPRGLRALTDSVATWSRSKLWIGYRIERQLRLHGRAMPPLLFAEHHQSHSASAFYPSPFERSAVLTVDGVGEWATASIGKGGPQGVEILAELRFPDSVGLLYSAITAFCGFDVNNDEFKVMGLAPYGVPRFAPQLREIVSVADDGAVALDKRYFAYRAGRQMTSRRLAGLLEGPPRLSDAPLTPREADLAASVQTVLEDILMKMAATARERTGEDHLCLAGGVLLNCVAASALRRSGLFTDVWVQPAAGDDGGAAGAALWAWHDALGNRRRHRGGMDGMSGCRLGPAFADSAIHDWLASIGVEHRCLEEAELPDTAAAMLADGAILGWFQGAMEFGPRALGCRSILGDPRRRDLVRRLNSSIKGREGFRPFAPAVLSEKAADWFGLDGDSPYMSYVANVRTARPAVRSVPDFEDANEDFAARLAGVESPIPACTHVDASARIQTVGQEAEPRFRRLIEAFEQHSSVPMVLNTSFNRDGEPIVRTPADALRCARAAELDAVVLGRCLVQTSNGIAST